MRVIKSPIGSFMSGSPLPARLHEPGNQALRSQLAQRDAAHLQLAIVAARTTGRFAAVANAGGRRVARQLRQLERGSKALLERPVLVARDLLETRTAGAERLRHLAAPVVLLDR